MNQTITTQIQNPFFTKIISAPLVLLIGLIIGRLLEKFLLKFFKSIELNKIIYEITGFENKADIIISKIVAYLVYFFSLIYFLNILGIMSLLLNIISAFVLLIIFIILFFSTKDFFPNLIASIYIRHKNIIKEGDYIKIMKIEGKVEEIDLLETKIRTKSNDLIIIPNIEILKNKMMIKKL